MMRLRRLKRLMLEDVRQLAGSVATKPFVVTDDWRPSGLDAADLADRMRGAAKQATPAQLSLF